MKCEIESAANFLSNLLRLHSSLLTGDQLENFRRSIETHLADHYQHHWFPDKPCKGSGYRCLRINHKMDPIIAKAGVTCGLDESALRTVLPNELTLWVDPREVSYRIGENGSICVLFEGDSSQTKPQGARNRNENSPRSAYGPSKGQSQASLQTSNHANHQQHHQQNGHQQQAGHQSQANRTTNASPSDSSLSSTTSTLSSPSPSSSPDWCRAERRSPVSSFPAHNGFSVPVSVSGPMEMNGFGAQANNGFAFNSNVVNARAGHFNGYGNHMWTREPSPPVRVESPFGGYSQPQQHHQQHQGPPPSIARRQHHNNTSPVSHHQQQGYNGWDSFLFEPSMNGRHHHPRHSHLNISANIEQVAAYVSS